MPNAKKSQLTKLRSYLVETTFWVKTRKSTVKNLHLLRSDRMVNLVMGPRTHMVLNFGTVLKYDVPKSTTCTDEAEISVMS